LNLGEHRPLRYVALGDSYTIGTSVREPDRWPNQLAATLESRARLELVANLAVTGYTSADLIARELPQLEELHPQFASLLIGVNDVVRGVPLEKYRSNVRHILGELLALLASNRIVVVSTRATTSENSGG
jgi:acyl-CoA thioesterase I